MGEASRTDQGTPKPWRSKEQEAMAGLGALEAMAGGLRGLGLATRPGHQSRDYIAPPKKQLGELTGLVHLGLNSGTGALLGLNSGTGLSIGTGVHSGLGSESEALSRPDESTTALLGVRGPLRIYSGTASISAT